MIVHPGEYGIIRDKDTGEKFRVAPQTTVDFEKFEFIMDCYDNNGRLFPQYWALKRFKHA